MGSLAETDSEALRLFCRFDGDDEDNLLALLAVYSAQTQAELSSARGSSTGRRPNIDRGAEEAHARLIKDYFTDEPVYSARTFRRRFRMRRPLYLKVVRAVEEHDTYFQQRRDATGKLGLSSLQKCTAAIRQLAYGMPADAVDEYVRIGESTAIKCLLRFCDAIIEVFGDEYLRAPSEEDVQRLLAMHGERGFDGQYKGKEAMPTIVLEAVVSRDLWFWHAFFGLPGSHNDINVLERSDLFSSLANMNAPPCNYAINGHEYNMVYYLADGIYPAWATLVQTIAVPRDNKEKHFGKKQEGARKDVERGFGVLQSRFAIVKGPGRFWSHADLTKIITTCIILHNMIVQDEFGEDLPNDYEGATSESVSYHAPTNSFPSFVASFNAIRSREQHFQLKADLVEHLWQLKGRKSD
ncbi:hypothetical protein PR003_g13160 [Phytophthora rubi]|uniref:DDE Tnp4 domain-containing protein n=1 Tax=Phytophthora rubi TaxID=129364 RepID=A0A6A3LXH1_9STRA|nr:hypothetical protein PR002_g12477 [Phytophthora rubi]KAE9335136.1 hypothetical protein PR003_g13160 [Phytophthora rubi]